MRLEVLRRMVAREVILDEEVCRRLCDKRNPIDDHRDVESHRNVDHGDVDAGATLAPEPADEFQVNVGVQVLEAHLRSVNLSVDELQGRGESRLLDVRLTTKAYVEVVGDDEEHLPR